MGRPGIWNTIAVPLDLGGRLRSQTCKGVVTRTVESFDEVGVLVVGLFHGEHRPKRNRPGRSSVEQALVFTATRHQVQTNTGRSS